MTKLADNEFVELWRSVKSAVEVSEMTGVTLRSVNKRRRSIELRHGIKLEVDDPKGGKFEHLQTAHKHNPRKQLGILNGTVIVFSDAHFWPGIHTTAFRGMNKLITQLAPRAIICNGDAFDGASISRFPRIGWDAKPSIVQELKACEIAMGEIEETAKAARRNVKLIWTVGNHDLRFENRLSQNAPQYEHVKGFSLRDHFPAWEHCWSCWPTETLIVKHRYKGGIHATHNNTVAGGVSIVTGHLHSLKVTPYSDYNGTRFGIDTGTLAEIDGPQFSDYLEDGPVNWRSGFAVLTFKDGKMLWPELAHKWDDKHIEFRGEIIKV